MHILVLHRYYWPDKAPCANILKEIVAHLADEGNRLEVVSSKPSRYSANESQEISALTFENSVKVNRLDLPVEYGRSIIRVTNAIRLGIYVLFKSLFNNYDVIISTSIPPVLGGFFSALSAKLTGSKFIYYSMDLHPELGQVSGDFKNPLLFKILQSIDNWTCLQADPVLVHSIDMLNTLRNRPSGNKFKIELVNNFAISSKNNHDHTYKHNKTKRQVNLRLIFAGNIGRFQGLESFIHALGIIKHRKDIELILIGEGAQKNSLKTSADELNANVLFLDYQPLETVKSIIKTADIGLVTLIPEMYKYAYPSKTMIYLEQGIPIITNIEANSELVKQMELEGYGFSVSNDDANIISEMLLNLADDITWKAPMKKAALKAFEKNFSSDIILQKWSNLLNRNARTIGIN